MNLKKTTLALALAGVMTAPAAFADLKMSGKLDVLVKTADDSSLDVIADDAEIDLTVVEKVGSVKWIGDIDLDFAEGDTTLAADDDVETFDLDAARVVGVGSFGAFVVGHSPSGIWADIYAAADVMAKNTDAFSNQGTQFNNAIAWKTPNFGPVYAVLASYSNGGDNEDVDIAVLRVVYKANGIKVGVVTLNYDIPGGTNEDRVRTAFGASYSTDAFSVAAFFEEDDRDIAGENAQEVTGFSATFNATESLTLKASFEGVENKGWTNDDEDDVTAFGFDYAISKNITLYGETASYDVDGQDNTLVGAVITF